MYKKNWVVVLDMIITSIVTSASGIHIKLPSSCGTYHPLVVELDCVKTVDNDFLYVS